MGRCHAHLYYDKVYQMKPLIFFPRRPAPFNCINPDPGQHPPNRGAAIYCKDLAVSAKESSTCHIYPSQRSQQCQRSRSDSCLEWSWSHERMQSMVRQTSAVGCCRRQSWVISIRVTAHKLHRLRVVCYIGRSPLDCLIFSPALI